MRIGVFCSGGDAPGMNACLRAVVRTAIGAGHEVVGIRHGYQGLLEEDFLVDCSCSTPTAATPLVGARTVGNIVKLGGTILHRSRSQRFRTGQGQAEAAEVLCTRLGAFAVRTIVDGLTCVMTGEVRGEPVLTPFAETYCDHKTMLTYFLDLLSAEGT